MRLTTKDLRTILALMDTLSDWKEDFETGPYKDDWERWNKRILPMFIDKIIKDETSNKGANK